MEPHKMREWGPKMAANIEAVIAEGKYPILIYRGMSGIAAATTIANFMSSNHGDDYAMMYVRKKNEKSHGRIIEYTKYNIAGRVSFADDLYYITRFPRTCQHYF
jgi:orotate phosphoribosyltransferase